MLDWLLKTIRQITFSDVGSIASLISLGMTFYVLYTVRKIKNFYVFKARVPELTGQLEGHASKLVEFHGDFKNSKEKILLEIGKAEVTLKDKRLRLYKKRFKVEEPSNPWIGATSILGHRKYPYWTVQIYLELIDTHGHSLWTFPEVSALSDLLTSVKYQVSGVKDFLNDLLEEQIAEQAG